MNKSQIDKVKQQLEEHGKVSRNWALRLRITRLASIINILNKDMIIEGHNGVDYMGNKDYVYIKKEQDTLIWKFGTHY